MTKIKILIYPLRRQKKDDIYLNERLKFRSDKRKCSSHIQTTGILAIKLNGGQKLNRIQKEVSIYMDKDKSHAYKTN